MADDGLHGIHSSNARLTVPDPERRTRMLLTKAPLPGTTIDPLYRDSDGRPMGDTDFHSAALVWLRDALQDFFVGLDVYIAMNLLMYYKQGDPKGRRDPDILVAKGVGTHKRRSFRFWEE